VKKENRIGKKINLTKKLKKLQKTVDVKV